MPKTNKKKSSSLQPGKLSFPADEKVHPWLSMLLEAYYVVDKGVAAAIGKEGAEGRKLACSKGCSNCCSTHSDIPVYQLELIGISWYVTEKISGAVRQIIKEQLKAHKKDSPCPFLIKGDCSIHPIRPIGCRQFNVFGKPCAEGEDPYFTRRKDVLPPVKKYVDQAFFIMFPFYGIEKESERRTAVESGTMHDNVKPLHDCNWKSLTAMMDRFDKKS